MAQAATSSSAEADSKSIEITVSYRERIALPPDAQLDVQLLDVSRAEMAAKLLASKRFAIAGVPMAVSLSYDPKIIDKRSRYALVAVIWSGEDLIFRSTQLYRVFDGADMRQVDILLTMWTKDDRIATAIPRSISGILWGVTEVAGKPWSNDDPATLAIDDEMNFSIFGGCNRFTGQLILSKGQISFPGSFAGTLMACPDQAEGLERSFLEALRRVSGYVRYGAGLVMTDVNGNALVHFEERLE
ncbi:YbaY family lipoprotein [Acidimangrovimonas sediminis]|uniref:YbaY family lipoprotein n=2 Tax=Albidovulum sediminis TaxID=3066345 RepID=A0ABT2NJ53_9RHOB|nr:YbaY family lipoprotein [Defluviimonas sediminis]